MRSFISKCKEIYYNKITPLSGLLRGERDCLELISIGKEIINEKGLNIFAGYFQEGQYYIDLWAAHIILEHSNPDEIIRQQAIRIIRDYSMAQLNPQVSLEEKNWLSKNGYSDNEQ